MPHHLEVAERTLAVLRGKLADEELEQLFDQGRRLSVDEAVALALEGSDLS
ncbi:MAG: hypothetical protein ICV64_02775 [Thermoleophilia bacterium]|nr:hypothetical protein [Thermoleophilia bacterium]